MTELIAGNLKRVRDAIESAAESSGRSADDVTLVGVTKYVDASVARQLYDAGCRDLGESRPQVLWDKAEVLAELDIRWHMIGHLQRNKVPRTVGACDLVHSVDSMRLIKAINAEGEKTDRVTNVLLEANVSGEQAKHGFSQDELKTAMSAIFELPHVKPCGLMCMAGLESDERETRNQFASLRKLREEIASAAPAGRRDGFRELSMGMSGDFEMAIEEGATIVRLGSILFEGIR